MVSLGTPLSPYATTVLLLGGGELGKEVVIELQRLGVETVAVDRYADAPAMQVAHRSHVIDMRASCGSPVTGSVNVSIFISNLPGTLTREAVPASSM